jgi:hypothetical protein
METKKDEIVLGGFGYIIVNIGNEQIKLSVENRDLLLNIIQYKVNDAIENNRHEVFFMHENDSLPSYYLEFVVDKGLHTFKSDFRTPVCNCGHNSYGIVDFLVKPYDCKGIPTVSFCDLSKRDVRDRVNLEISQWYVFRIHVTIHIWSFD